MNYKGLGACKNHAEGKRMATCSHRKACSAEIYCVRVRNAEPVKRDSNKTRNSFGSCDEFDVRKATQRDSAWHILYQSLKTMNGNQININEFLDEIADASREPLTKRSQRLKNAPRINVATMHEYHDTKAKDAGRSKFRRVKMNRVSVQKLNRKTLDSKLSTCRRVHQLFVCA